MNATGLRAALCLALAALCFAIYAQVRHHEFVDYDDYITILHNDALEVSSLPEALRVAVTPHHANWIPLTTLSFVFDRWLYGSEPRGYLLGNVALHALACALLFLALDTMTGAPWRSAFVAAVFAAHPLHVESVAWANERKDVLSGLFWMLALAAHAGWAARPKSPLRYAALLACVLLALLAKPMAATLPCALLLLDYWPLRRLSWRAVLEKLPMFAAVVAVSIIAIDAQRSEASLDFGARLPFAVRSANAIDGYGSYLRQSFWPSGLAAFYPWTGGSASATRGLVAAALCAVTAAAIVLRRSRPYLIVGWLWFLGTLVPVIGLVQVGPQGHADRYTYIPQIGLTIALAWGACDLARNRWARGALAAAAVAALAALSAAAFVQVGYWRNSTTLFERMLAISPDAYLPHERLATHELRAGRIESAGRYFQRAFEIEPAKGRANLVRFELGSAESALRRGKPAAAIEHWLAALRLDPGLDSARNDLAWLLATAADPALRDPEHAVRLAEVRGAGAAPASANELDTLAAAYAAAGRFEAALRTARQALAIAQKQDARLAREIEARVRAFERGEAWVEPAPAAAAGDAANPR